MGVEARCGSLFCIMDTQPCDEFVACLGCNQTLGIGQAEYCPQCRKQIAIDVAELLESANQWPIEERGEKRGHEGWEELQTWERAFLPEPLPAEVLRLQSAQLWLYNVRNQITGKADNRWLDLEYSMDDP